MANPAWTREVVQLGNTTARSTITFCRIRGLEDQKGMRSDRVDLQTADVLAWLKVIYTSEGTSHAKRNHEAPPLHTLE